MNADDKRQLENELLAMGLPDLNDPALLQVMADMVNGYPIMAERADFFCEMLNECEGAHRREMYEAMRPRLSFPVPSLDECEARIAARAERLIRPKGLPAAVKAEAPVGSVMEIICHGCGKKEEFTSLSTAGAMVEARKAGWGRGPVGWKEYCPECRITAMPPKPFGDSLTRRLANA
jgi:hypothetical protein